MAATNIKHFSWMKEVGSYLCNFVLLQLDSIDGAVVLKVYAFCAGCWRSFHNLSPAGNGDEDDRQQEAAWHCCEFAETGLWGNCLECNIFQNKNKKTKNQIILLAPPNNLWKRKCFGPVLVVQFNWSVQRH